MSDFADVMENFSSSSSEGVSMGGFIGSGNGAQELTLFKDNFTESAYKNIGHVVLLASAFDKLLSGFQGFATSVSLSDISAAGMFKLPPAVGSGKMASMFSSKARR